MTSNQRNQIKTFDIPTRTEQDDFLLRLYFGKVPPVRACVDRAYLDFSRTLHGMSQFAGAVPVRTEASEQLCLWLVKLRDLGPNPNQDSFDGWHRARCAQLCTFYSEHGFSSFTIGQAQKWLNMALKYVYVFGEERLPGFAGLYPLCHVPLDNIILARLAPRSAPRFSVAWSRISGYDEYLDYQRWIRHEFPGSAPLAVEFHLWQILDSDFANSTSSAHASDTHD